MKASDVIAAWDTADPCSIHPTRALSETEYWESGETQASVLTTVIPSGSTILDFGCGDGRVAIPLHHRGYEVIGVDSSTRMVTALTRNEPKIRGIVTTSADLAERLPKRPDVVICLAVLIHHSYDDGEEIITRLREVTRPGGLLILDWPTNPTPYERRTWIEVTTWSPQAQQAVADRLDIRRVNRGLPWPTFEVP